MIEVTLKELISSTESLKIISEKEVLAKWSFIFKKVIKKCQEEIDTFEKARVQKVKELSLDIMPDEKDEEAHKKRKENNDRFQKEMMELLEIKINIDSEKIKFHELDIPKIPSRVVTELDWLILEN